MRTIDFYFSIDSRYSYLATTQLPALERDFGVTIAWRPLALFKLLEARGKNPFADGGQSGQYDPAYRGTDVTRWADLYGVPLISPDWDKGDWLRINLSAVSAAALDCCPAYVRALFDAVMVRGETPADDAAIARLADRAGLDGKAIVAGIDSGAAAALHRANIEAAIAAGVFGVPSFVAGKKMFWGNDRIALLRHELQKRR
jgi:2-hydroxychromene-2-carboxylate isomerase